MDYLPLILSIALLLILALIEHRLRQIASQLESMGDILTDQLSAVLDELRKEK